MSSLLFETLTVSRDNMSKLITVVSPLRVYVGLARTIYTRSMSGMFGREITKYTVYIYVYTDLANPVYACI
jgi:hypothetical protein